MEETDLLPDITEQAVDWGQEGGMEPLYEGIMTLSSVCGHF